MNRNDAERMTRLIEHQTAVILKHPDGARLQLIGLGTHRPDGELHESYGGPEMTETERAAFHAAQEEANRELRAWLARPEHRDLDLNPLSAVEVRARDHLVATTGQTGGGDPVGALIAAHASLLAARRS